MGIGFGGRIDYRYWGCGFRSAAFFSALLYPRHELRQPLNFLFARFARDGPGVNDARVCRTAIQRAIWFRRRLWPSRDPARHSGT